MILSMPHLFYLQSSHNRRTTFHLSSESPIPSWGLLLEGKVGSHCLDWIFLTWWLMAQVRKAVCMPHCIFINLLLLLGALGEQDSHWLRMLKMQSPAIHQTTSPLGTMSQGMQDPRKNRPMGEHSNAQKKSTELRFSLFDIVGTEFSSVAWLENHIVIEAERNEPLHDLAWEQSWG